MEMISDEEVLLLSPSEKYITIINVFTKQEKKLPFMYLAGIINELFVFPEAGLVCVYEKQQNYFYPSRFHTEVYSG